jgi:hypothetical protein
MRAGAGAPTLVSPAKPGANALRLVFPSLTLGCSYALGLTSVQSLQKKQLPKIPVAVQNSKLKRQF